MNWLRVLTYVGAGLAAGAAYIFPVVSSILTPIAAGLAGLATRGPGMVPAPKSTTTEGK